MIYKMERECAWCLEMAAESKLAEVILQHEKWKVEFVLKPYQLRLELPEKL